MKENKIYCDRCGKECKKGECVCKDTPLLYYKVDLCEECYDKLVDTVEKFLEKKRD